MPLALSALIDFLTSTTEEQTLNFQQAKINLRKEYIEYEKQIRHAEADQPVE
jgi:hypothetical protein